MGLWTYIFSGFEPIWAPEKIISNSVTFLPIESVIKFENSDSLGVHDIGDSKF